MKPRINVVQDLLSSVKYGGGHVMLGAGFSSKTHGNLVGVLGI